MSRRIEMRWSEDLQPYDELYAHVFSMCGQNEASESLAHLTVVWALEELSSSELLKLQEAAADVTQTNCWWVTYNVRNAIQCVVEALA